MNKKLWIVGALAVIASIAMVVSSEETEAAGGGFGSCPYKNMQCLDVYDPVTCSNGVTYPNDCYARRACQFNCSGGNASM